MLQRMRGEKGQATVEAAFVLPVLLLVVLLLLQPGILLYDRIVMEGAAAQGCRLLATSTGLSSQQCSDYVRRRLGAVPMQQNFHMHEGGCTWEVKTAGSAGSSVVTVSISTKVKPLPLIDAGAKALGVTDESGCFTVTASASSVTQPSWVDSSPAGRSPVGWIGAWFDEA